MAEQLLIREAIDRSRREAAADPLVRLGLVGALPIDAKSALGQVLWGGFGIYAHGRKIQKPAKPQSAIDPLLPLAFLLRQLLLGPAAAGDAAPPRVRLVPEGPG